MTSDKKIILSQNGELTDENGETGLLKEKAGTEKAASFHIRAVGENYGIKEDLQNEVSAQDFSSSFFGGNYVCQTQMINQEKTAADKFSGSVKKSDYSKAFILEAASKNLVLNKTEIIRGYKNEKTVSKAHRQLNNTVAGIADSGYDDSLEDNNFAKKTTGEGVRSVQYTVDGAKDFIYGAKNTIYLAKGTKNLVNNRFALNASFDKLNYDIVQLPKIRKRKNKIGDLKHQARVIKFDAEYLKKYTTETIRYGNTKPKKQQINLWQNADSAIDRIVGNEDDIGVKAAVKSKDIYKETKAITSTSFKSIKNTKAAIKNAPVKIKKLTYAVKNTPEKIAAVFKKILSPAKIKVYLAAAVAIVLSFVVFMGASSIVINANGVMFLAEDKDINEVCKYVTELDTQFYLKAGNYNINNWKSAFADTQTYTVSSLAVDNITGDIIEFNESADIAEVQSYRGNMQNTDYEKVIAYLTARYDRDTAELYGDANRKIDFKWCDRVKNDIDELYKKLYSIIINLNSRDNGEYTPFEDTEKPLYTYDKMKNIKAATDKIQGEAYEFEFADVELDNCTVNYKNNIINNPFKYLFVPKDNLFVYSQNQLENMAKGTPDYENFYYIKNGETVKITGIQVNYINNKFNSEPLLYPEELTDKLDKTYYLKVDKELYPTSNYEYYRYEPFCRIEYNGAVYYCPYRFINDKDSYKTFVKYENSYVENEIYYLTVSIENKTSLDNAIESLLIRYADDDKGKKAFAYYKSIIDTNGMLFRAELNSPFEAGVNICKDYIIDGNRYGYYSQNGTSAQSVLNESTVITDIVDNSIKKSSADMPVRAMLSGKYFYNNGVITITSPKGSYVQLSNVNADGNGLSSGQWVSSTTIIGRVASRDGLKIAYYSCEADAYLNPQLYIDPTVYVAENE